MSEYEEDELMRRLERWDAKKERHKFIAKMERKFSRKEQFGR